MSNYKKGTRLEYEVWKIFEAAGWDIVRAASSKGKFGGFKPDIIATKRTNENNKEVWIVLSQCKIRKR